MPRDFIDEDRIRHLLKLVPDLVRQQQQASCRDVIDCLKKFPKEATLSSDDSGFAGFWEEFKYQVQRQESLSWNVYESAVRSLCRAVVESLPQCTQGLLWIWTDEYIEAIDCETESSAEIPWGDLVIDALENELWKEVCAVAAVEELRYDPDDARAQQRFEEDLGQ
ncbi:MAG: hypothetical protein JSS02_26970 [Planctomycetes bacterium]|nr:hypothetical protein [Planctomycetota bacterium]